MTMTMIKTKIISYQRWFNNDWNGNDYHDENGDDDNGDDDDDDNDNDHDKDCMDYCIYDENCFPDLQQLLKTLII